MDLLDIQCCKSIGSSIGKSIGNLKASNWLIQHINQSENIFLDMFLVQMTSKLHRSIAFTILNKNQMRWLINKCCIVAGVQYSKKCTKQVLDNQFHLVYCYLYITIYSCQIHILIFFLLMYKLNSNETVFCSCLLIVTCNFVVLDTFPNYE